MIRSINTKLIRISLVSIMITALIITSFFIFFSRRALRREAYDKLNSEASYIENLFIDTGNIDALKRALGLRKVLMLNRLILIDENMEYKALVVNEGINDLNSKIVEKIATELTDGKKYISFNVDGTSNIGIAYRVKILTKDILQSKQIIIKWLFIYVPVNEISLNGVVLKVFFFSLILSLIVGLAISVYFSRKITKPFKLLSTYSKKISQRKFDEVKVIDTGDEFEDLSTEIVKMADTLKTYDEKQKEFFQNASHNLKTPLMSIRGYAEAILDNVFENNEKTLNTIIDETDKLTELVRKILFISRSESIEEFYKFEDIRLNEILNEIKEKVSSIANEGKISLDLKVEDDLYVNADREKLINAIMNIFSNAIRYTNTMIDLRVSAIEDKVHIIIEDDGPGITNGEEERIFERFYKGNKGNFGLGLSISKMIINKHNGTIRAFNGEFGACFEIILIRKRIKKNDHL